ncbi:hypothetical protein [Novosphingobium sp. BL-52-GroH]|uniref:hypothetical protein n=1 Tax=Novosphingobium sp. BL-52-GroH TaxID=3349877 RepID=UPI00384C44E9
MYEDEEPLNSHRDIRKIAVADPAMPHAAWTSREGGDKLFEDILDVEGALRVAMASAAGFYVTDIDKVELGIGELAGRLPEPSASQLRAHAQALRAAIDAKDAPQVRANQAVIVETLTALRKTLA